MKRATQINGILLVLCTFFLILQPQSVWAQSYQELLGLQPPIEVEQILPYRDGGTIGIQVRDAKEKIFSFCLDGRVEIYGWKDYDPNRPPQPKHVFIFSTHPTGKGAKKVAIGGREEKAIIQMLQEWLDVNASVEEQKRIAGASWQDLSEEENKIQNVIHLIEKVKKRQ